MSAAGNNTAPGRRVNTFDVFVGNLPQDADQKKVGKVFSKFGEVHGIWINNSSDGNKFGIVKFYCEEDSLKAIEESNGMVFEGGKTISCKKALKRNSMKKDGDQEGQDKEDWSKDSNSQVRQRNPDIVPSFESITPSYNNAGGGFVKKEKERVLISHVETPIIIWGQRMLEENANDLANISEQLTLICPESPTITGKPDQEKIYGAKFSEDEQWYRCTIRYIYGPDRIKVQYIDFGNTEEINPSTLVELPKSLTALPTCAMKYMLHSMWCNNNQDQLAIAFLKEMVEGKEVEAHPTARLTDQTGFYAKVFVDSVNVGDKMMEAGHAFRKPGLEARGVRARMNAGPMGDGGGPPNFSQKPGMMPSNMPPSRDVSRKMEGGMVEKDDLANLRWKLKSLQMEHSALTNKMQEFNISVQLRDIKMIVSRVRKLRNQFPLDQDTPLDLAIELVQNPGKISAAMTESLPGVVKTIDSYKQAQDEILKSSSDDSTLQDLIESRNSVRKQLHQELSVTIEELKNVPLQDRGKRVQDVVTSLSKNYDYFTRMGVHNPAAIDQLAPAFQEWKVKKVADVRDCRRLSDTMESTVNSVFDQLKQVMSLNADQEETETQEDLTVCLKNYIKALQQEIAVSDTENSPDALLIGSLVQALLRELQEESTCVEHLGNVMKEFGNLLESITPWLDSTPSLDKLQKIRSKLKGLKSKLRHKLADKVDAEENQETEELETIAQDLETIRLKLHEILKEEDAVVAEVSQLANTHFPELLHSSPDPGFKMSLTYKGLVKPSYAPEHFTMTPLGDSDSGMYISKFAGEEVLIKEFFLKSGNHLEKDEFLNQLAIYSLAVSTFLEPIKAVFFDKNNRQAYVVFKKEGTLLSELLKQSALAKEKCKTVVGCLSRALDALNRINFVHGQVRPEFVMVTDDGKACLLPPDFSFSTAERCHSRFLPGFGMEMMPPELRHPSFQAEPSHFTDVYCLGLLALWMHHPSGSFLLRKDGVIDFGHLSVDRNFGIFLTRLLSPIPHNRPSAENTLHSEYLNQPEQPAGLGSHIGGGMSSDLDNQMFSRNSTSPVVLPQPQSNDGRVFANTGDNIQIIADLRVPPPPFNADNSQVLMQTPVSNFHHQQQQQQQQQQQHQQQQFPVNPLPQQSQPLPPQPTPSPPMSSQLTEQPNVESSYEAPPPPPPTVSNPINSSEENQMIVNTPKAIPQNSGGVFEIGTFDPTACEVVTIPQTQEDLAVSQRSSPPTDNNGTEDWADCTE